MRQLRYLVMAAVVIVLSACGGHHHGGTKTVRVLDAEHNDRTVVIIRTRPAKGRNCWKHGGHWHCRRI